MARNLEIKVACGAHGLDDVRRRLAERGLTAGQRLDQVDTYFRVPSGRLKLRELANWPGERGAQEAERTAEVIGYARGTVTGSRWSEYYVAPVAVDAVETMRAALSSTIGKWVTVDKRRDVVTWGATRVHLDEVTALGCFVELETVIGEQDDAAAEREHAEVIDALGLDRWEVVAGSYSDLLGGTDTADGYGEDLDVPGRG